MNALIAEILKDPLPLAITALISLCIAMLVFYGVSGGKKKRKTGPLALDKEKWIPFTLIEKENISHDVRRFRFALQSENHILGLPIGQHISFQYKTVNAEGLEKVVMRSYTPTTSDDEIGYVDFVIKVYSPLPPRFPEGGAMSQYLDKLKIGESIEMKGPKGHLDYEGRGRFTISKPREGTQSYKVKRIGMVCGGTGKYMYTSGILYMIIL